MAKINLKKVFKTIKKVLLWIFLSIVIIILIVIIGVQIPYVQNKIVNFGITKVREKVNTEISLGSFDLILPNYVRLNKLYVEDPSGDTLLYAGKISVSIGLSRLIRGNISINKFTLEDAVGKISREKGDSLFNFNFFIEAFSNPSGQNDKKGKIISEAADPGSQQSIYADSVERRKNAGQESVKDSSGNSFSIGKIELSDVRFLYDDGYTGNYVNAEIGDFFVSFREFNLKNNIIDVNRTGLSNSQAIIKLSPTKDTEPSDNSLSILLRRTSKLKNVSVSLDMPGTNLHVNHANLRINPDDVNIGDKKIGLKSVLISDSEIIYTKTKLKGGASLDSLTNSVKSESNSFEWLIYSSSFRLRKNHIVYSDLSKTDQNTNANSIFSNLNLNDVSAVINDIKLSNNLYQAFVKEFRFREKQGLVLREFTAKLDVRDKVARLEDFKLRTNNSIIYNNTVAHYNSFSNIGNDIANIELISTIGKSQISPADIRFFAPAIAPQLTTLTGPKGKLYISGSFSGKVKDLKVESLSANNDKNFFLDLNGQIRGLPDAKSAYYKINLDSLSVLKSHVLAFLPDSTIPENISIPEKISII